MPQNFYELVWVFIVYAFIGWCTEVSYATLDTGKFVNRGFLNGPYCPIYGVGVVIVVAVLTPLQDSLLILFIGSFLLTSILEFITGFVLEKVFHNKWWDYSEFPFNIKGYVCLKFSIYWGLACTFVMKIVHPIIYGVIVWIPHTLGVVLVSIFMCVFFVDLGITIATILKFNKRLKIMDELAASIHKISDEIGESIYENVSGAIEKSEEFQDNHAELLSKIAETKENLLDIPEGAKEKLADVTETARGKLADATESAREKLTVTIGEMKQEHEDQLAEKQKERTALLEEKRKEREELMERYEKMFEEKSLGFKRLVKAFPDMRSRDNSEALQGFKDRFSINIRRKNQQNG